ncbi:unnamed protein product [Rotaria sordida]|uniref:Uncharacterized protein n=1 Tax=Rotaria sordida TaxID=392033 RepID=A0A814QAL1_9BILA|nr:unnamed protein product [Rotaria sordida]CAF1298958.1 unnamed protein product [Rotaria sordida]CAF1352795.1 unnamed protein product [Rotaria sordida]CAF3641887.1 unnamed protein product [Rotaria sordida]CAF3680970.1 unnamed protein product [Rotaria sordida]
MINSNMMIIRSIRYASSTAKTSSKPVDDYTYCINNVRKVDYENFICTGLLRPSSLQRPTMAIRALNAELASIRDQVSNTQIGQMRLQFWRETIDAIYSSLNTNVIKKINQPVAREINLVIKHNQLTKLWFHRLIKSRETTLNDMPFTDIEQLENYLEQSITPTYYLLLELAKQRSLNTDHIASHLGRSQGLINIVRGIPYNAHKRRCFIPLSYLIEYNVSQQDIFNGQFSTEQCRHVIYQLCNQSWFHLQKTIELFEQEKNFQKENIFSSLKKNHNRSLFLPIIVIYDYLKQIMFGLSSTTTQKDVEVIQPPDDAISCMKFSPASVPQTYLIASSWANDIRCWEIQSNGQTIAKAMQKHDAPILSCCWSDDGTKVFTASCDKTAKMWDLQSNTFVQIAAHDQPIRTINYIQRPSYACVMTGGWDRTVKFWDTRQATPLKQLALTERIYAADVFGPMAVITTADRAIQVYSLDQGPTEYKKIESLLKYQHRCISIFTDKSRNPNGFAIGSIEGRVAITYVDTPNPAADNFTFKCHRSTPTATSSTQDIFSVNDIAFHPIHGTLATVGSDGRYSFWDKDDRTKLKTSDVINDQSITCCAFDSRGQLFGYASSYDWHKGHEGNIQTKKNVIYLRPCFEEMKPKQKK